jgi:hypothetical protein
MKCYYHHHDERYQLGVCAPQKNCQQNYFSSLLIRILQHDNITVLRFQMESY